MQPCRLAIVGEKSSPEPVLGPVAASFSADLYLSTGKISETQVHRMASVAAQDGRPLIVFYFSDCDPAGWQMGISVARKLQAFRELLGEKLEFEVHRVALTPDQVSELSLTCRDRRSRRWSAHSGTSPSSAWRCESPRRTAGTRTSERVAFCRDRTDHALLARHVYPSGRTRQLGVSRRPGPATCLLTG